MRQPPSSAVLALAILFLADPRTAGAALLDPTRPLAGGGREETAAPKPAETLTAAMVPVDVASAPATPPALQSLQVPQQGEATAIVDGQLLKVGGKLGSYEVTHIDAHGLMVRGPAGRERWTLAGVEVLDSRQSAASLKMGPMGEVRKPSRRPSADVNAPLQDLLPRGPGAAVPSPLVFPLPTPQSQPGLMPRPAQPPEQPPQTTPSAPNPVRPAIKQALAAATPWSPATATSMTVAYQPMVQPVRRANLPLKRGATSKAWTAAAPSKNLRLDLDDMRRVIQMVPQPAKVVAAVSATGRWQHPVGPQPYGAWVATWATAPVSAQRQTMTHATSGLVWARWQMPEPTPKIIPAKVTMARYAPVQGPRPMPASVVWRQTRTTAAWQPQGANDLPGAHTSQWASAAAPLLRIAALEPRAGRMRTFAMASAKPWPRSGVGTRWAQERKAPVAQAAGPVTHAYPMALPQWRSAPTAQADNSSLTQVAYALETP